MYYPHQIPYRLDQSFHQFVSYQETTVDELSAVCMCIWEMKSKQIIDRVIMNQILPDACIDIVFDFVNQSICFAGYSKETEAFPLYQEIDYMGVRLRPGAFYALYEIDADRIMDHMVPFADIESKYHLDHLLSCHSKEERIACIKEYLTYKLNSAPKLDFIALVNELYENPKEHTVILTAKKLGYNQRQLLRIFHKHYGVSPKVLLNILRLHLCLTLLKQSELELSDIAVQCGFYDQSHFIKEIKRYTDISPLKLLSDA